MKLLVALVLLTIFSTASVWNQLQSSHCSGSSYGSHSSLSGAKAACESHPNCGFVYDAYCDNRAPFNLCPVGATISPSTSWGSCMYEKADVCTHTVGWERAGGSHSGTSTFEAAEDAILSDPFECRSGSEPDCLLGTTCHDKAMLCSNTWGVENGITVLTADGEIVGYATCCNADVSVNSHNVVCSSCRTTSEENCVFPFVFEGIQFDSCTDYDSWDGFWCATEVGDGNVLISDRWDYCDLNTCESETAWHCDIDLLHDASCDCGCGTYDSNCEWSEDVVYNDRCPTGQQCDAHHEPGCIVRDVDNCRTFGEESQRCIFPFIFDGIQFDSCTDYHEPDGHFWCATEVFSNNRMDSWDYCNLNTCETETAWQCDIDLLYDARCDYGCGNWDYNCEGTADGPRDHCPSGQWYDSNNVAHCIGEGLVPLRWICNDNWWYDGICHCGCGYLDYDCDFEGAECEVDACTYGREYADDMIGCQYGHSRCESINGNRCLGPFWHNGIWFTEHCTNVDNDDINDIKCPVELSDNNVPIVWETCNRDNPLKPCRTYTHTVWTG